VRRCTNRRKSFSKRNRNGPGQIRNWANAEGRIQGRYVPIPAVRAEGIQPLIHSGDGTRPGSELLTAAES